MTQSGYVRAGYDYIGEDWDGNSQILLYQLEQWELEGLRVDHARLG